MKLKQILVMLALARVALPLAAQMGMGPQVPTLSGIWHPVVGSGSTYEITRDGKKTSMDFAVLGKEDLDGKTGYWMEMSMADTRHGGDIIIKVLETVDGNTITYHKMGDANARSAAHGNGFEHDEHGRPAERPDAVGDFRDKAELVGTESITVPAGTFTCEHYRMKDGSGDAWISDKVVAVGPCEDAG